MSVALLSYADLGARLNISREAARALAKRRRLPRSRSEDGLALVSVDLSELRYKPRPRIGRQAGRQADHIAASITESEMAEIEALRTAALETAALEIEGCRAEIARLEAEAIGYRADAEREWERANRLAAELQQAVAETIVVNERAARLAIEALEIEACKAEIAQLEAEAADTRADFERERERADRLAVELQQAAAETMAVNQRLEASEIEAGKAEIARLEAMAADTRADFERERERADRLAVELEQAAAETMAANERAARLENDVEALRSGGADGSIAGQAAHRLGRLAASIVEADRAARR